MSSEKQKQNQALLEKLDQHLDSVSPDELFKELEGRYPEGVSLEEVFEAPAHIP